ncbi:FAD-dependent oxidoreductase [Streptomyces seoulensis]|nr:FAD-dependent oxidoreductase [Streptomyces seoulensis]
MIGEALPAVGITEGSLRGDRAYAVLGGASAHGGERPGGGKGGRPRHGCAGCQAARRVLAVLVAVSTTADLDRYSMHAFAETVRFQGGLAAMLSTRGGAQEALVTEGAGTLTDRPAAELGPRVLTGRRVTSIRYDDGGATLHTTSGAVRAGRVMVAVPPPLSGRIGYDPPLPANRTELERNTYMGSVYKAIAVYERPLRRKGGGHAEFVMLGEPGGAVFDTSPSDGPGYLCVLVAGAEARNLDRLAFADRRRTLLQQLAPHLGPEILEPVTGSRGRWAPTSSRTRTPCARSAPGSPEPSPTCATARSRSTPGPQSAI